MFRSHRLYQEVHDRPLLDRAPRLDVPVHIAAGLYDYITPAAHAREFLDGVVASTKSWTEFTDFAHAPFIEEPGRFEAFLGEKLAA